MTQPGFADVSLFRRLTSDRGFFFAALLFLALGIGSVSAIFSVVNGVLLKPLPYADPDRIVRVDRVQGNFSGPVSQPLFFDWQEGTKDVFSALAGMTSGSHVLSGEGWAERITVYEVTPEFWSVMGLGAAHGRYFNAAEDSTNERVAVLSHGLWQSRFGGDRSIVGKSIRLDGENYRVLGIAPAAFRYPGTADLYRPAGLASADPARGNNYIQVIGRLRNGMDVERASNALETVNARLAQDYPDTNGGLSARLTGLSERLNSDIRQPLLILLGASLMVLLIACTNLGGLLLVRASRRRHELALRSAIGADRKALVRFMLGEALALTVIGGLAGIALAALGLPLLVNLAPEVLPSHAQPRLNGLVAGIGILLGLIVALVFALWPALKAANVPPQHAMQQSGRRTGATRGQNRVRSALVIAQIALSMVLLVAAGLMIESLRRLGETDPGMNTENLLTAGLALSVVEPQPGEETLAWYARQQHQTGPALTRLIEILGAIPGVRSVALTDALPMSGLNNINSGVTIVGQEPPDPGDTSPWAQWRLVNPEFFSTMGIAILGGRGIENQDWRTGEFPSTVVVNQKFVDSFFEGNDPIGRQLAFLDGSPKTIVGVVANTSLYGLDEEPIPEVYLHYGYAPLNQFQLGLRVASNPDGYTNALRQAVREHDPGLPLFDIMPMSQRIAAGSMFRRFNMTLMSLFSAVALLLAVVGLYAVIAYVVAQRRHEFGVRLSLGATTRSVLGLVLGHGIMLALAGCLLGLIGAVFAGRLIESQLFGVNAFEPGVFTAIAVSLTMAAMLACLVPAWQASRISPMNVFRQG